MKTRYLCCLAIFLTLPCLARGERAPLQLGGRLPDSRNGVVVWWALSSAAKIRPGTPAPQRQSATVQIRCARNERECVQVVVRPEKPLKQVLLEASALMGPNQAVLSSSHIEILQARYVDVTRATDKSATTGLWPDPLLPLHGPIGLRPRINNAFWLRVFVPRAASPGVYYGTLRMQAEDWEAKVPLELTVYSFALPDEMTCQTAFGFSPGEVFRYQHLRDEKSKREVLAKYLADLSAHHISPYDPAPLDPFKVTWPDIHPPTTALEREPRRKPCLPPGQLRPTFDFSAWDKAMTKAIDFYHFNSFSVPVPGLGGGTFYQMSGPNLLGFGEDSPEYPLLLGSYCRQLQAHLRAEGWLDQAFIYWFDEPSPDQFPFLQKGFAKLKRYCPDIRRMITKCVEPGLVGGPNLWCPISNQYNQAHAEARRKLGERFWWYVCTGPKAPYAGEFIDHSAPEMRIWLWQTFKRNINGILIWQCNYWNSSTAYPDPAKPQNPYADPMSWTSGYGTPRGTKAPWGNGDGRFIYPPLAAVSNNTSDRVLQGPVDSIRWEQLRDGIEDYEYLTILRRKLDDRRGSLDPEQLANYEKLLRVPAAITRSITHFAKDGSPIELRRDQIARAIESL
jgi:Glycoside hydrolase 123, catalytic domain/Glycoside hydrolase 123 N-terminal domain